MCLLIASHTPHAQHYPDTVIGHVPYNGIVEQTLSVGRYAMSDRAPQRPPTDNDKGAWNAYWTELGMAWRTEPEIGDERQQYLAARRAITANTEQGIYPFKDVRLDRADIEWLLATHQGTDVRGPVEWSLVERDQPKDTWRLGLDLRGADVRGQVLDALPLTRLRGGLTRREWTSHRPELTELAAVHFEGASLARVHLEGAELRGAHLDEANLTAACLQYTVLSEAHLEKASLVAADLERAHMPLTHVSEANLASALCCGAFAQVSNLRRANLHGANLDRADFSEAQMEGCTLTQAVLRRTKFVATHLAGANLRASKAQEAWFERADLA